MALPLKIVAALAVVVALALGPSPARSAETATPNDTARFLAGMRPSAQSPLTPLTQDPAWQQHAQMLDKVWVGLDEHQLSKVRSWSRANVTARRPVTFYFFSGPDFLYADAFFPNASTYILAGLEPIGQPPDVLALRARSLPSDLDSLRTSISTLLSRSYFITSYMGSDLRAGQFRGILPVLYVFMARTDKTIHEVSFVSVAQDGSLEPAGEGKDAARGVKIVFSGADNKKQSLYYFRTDLSNKGVQSTGFLEFCRQLGIGDVFIKAASYLLHTGAFSAVRDFLLGQGATVVQDDFGIPLKYFEQRGWRVQAFGRYVGPIPVFRGNFQSKLKRMFEQGGGAPPIAFGIGYRWRTNQSHVLLAINPHPQSLPKPAVVAQPEKAPQANPQPEIAASTPPASPPIVRPEKPLPEKVLPDKAPPEKTASNPPSAQRDKAGKAKSPPPKVSAPTEASRFTTWPSLLFGGLFSAALVGLFGLEGVAAGLGFILQAAVIGAIVWVAISLLRTRANQPALAATGSSVDRDATAAQQGQDAALTRGWPSGLADRLRRWTSS